MRSHSLGWRACEITSSSRSGHHGRHIDWAESASEAGLCGGEGGAYARFARAASASIVSAGLFNPRSGSVVLWIVWHGSTGCGATGCCGWGAGAIGCSGVGRATPFGAIGCGWTTWGFSNLLMQLLRCCNSLAPACGSTGPCRCMALAARVAFAMNCDTSVAHCVNPARKRSAYDISGFSTNCPRRFRL